ncbi:MAG TPA: beta-propeller fold lactonase family protein [Acidobacteriaceae bacterium]|nr:beta-propeller fold lactonase family protein [Acidobacteriaceae bacterium]
MPGSPYTLTEAIGCLHFLPGGKFAYATPGIDEATPDLVTLAMDPGGKLSIINSIPLPSVPDGLAIDPQGKFLYIASEAITTNGASAAYGYTIDSTTGALTPIDGTPLQLPNTTYGYFSFNPSGDFLYLSYGSANTIAAYSVNRNSGALTAAGAVSSCINPNALQFSPTGKYAFDNCADGGLVSFSVGADGQLTQIGIIPTQPGFQNITVDPSGQFVYMLDHLNYLSTYRIGADGSLKQVNKTAGRVLQESIAFLPGSAPVAYTTQSAYLTSSGDDHLTSYTVNPDGSLIKIQSSPTLPSPFSLATLPWASDLLLASDAPKPNLQAFTATNTAGGFTPGLTFGSATSPGGLIMDPSGKVAFDSDSSTGLIYWYWQTLPGAWGSIYTGSTTLATFTAQAGAGPLAMDPAGRFLFVANQTANSISEFEYAGAAPVAAFPLPASPLAICAGPFGNHLFVAGDDKQLRMLTVNSNGTFTDTFDISLPDTPNSVAVEPAGQTAYVTSASGITAFTINQQAETMTELPLNVSGSLANATGVFIDPSGKYLYVAVSSSMSNALYLFTIHTDGTLSSAPTEPVATPNKVTSMAFHTQVQ